MSKIRSLAVGMVFAIFAGCSFGGGDQARVVAYFADVGDLVERSTVQVRDVEVGTVDNIELVLRDGRMIAKVTMTVPARYEIPADDIGAIVRQTSLLGEQFVELLPVTGGSGGPIVGRTDVTIPLERTDRRVDVETVLADLSGLLGGGSLEDLNRFTHAQALILEGRGERFGQTLDELERFTEVLADRKLDISQALDSLADASQTLAGNTATIDSFLDSLEGANALLAEEGDELARLFSGLRRFGEVSAGFVDRHQDSIRRQFEALEPILGELSENSDELRVDIAQLRTFFALFTRSVGGGPGGDGQGDYIQAEAVLCEVLSRCHTKGERGDVPGEGR